MDDQLDWQEILRLFPDGVMVTAPDFTIRFINPAFKRLLRNGAVEVVGGK